MSLTSRLFFYLQDCPLPIAQDVPSVSQTEIRIGVVLHVAAM